MKKVGFAILAACFVFLLAELGLMAVGYQGDPTLRDFRFQIASELYGEPDAKRFWRLRDRNPSFTGDAPRIVCMADSASIMEIWGKEEGKGWPDRLPQALKEAGYEGQAQVFNAGVPEYTSFQGLQFLEHELLAYGPKIVTIQFGWNDHWPSRMGKPDREVVPPPAVVMAFQKRFGRLRLYRLLRTWIKPLPVNSDVLRVPLDHYEYNLRRMVELVRAQNGYAVLITAPYLEGPWGWRGLHRDYNDKTRQVAEQTGAPLVDIADAFLHEPGLFIDPDVDQCHFNAEGAKLLVRAVAKLIIKQKLLE